VKTFSIERGFGLESKPAGVIRCHFFQESLQGIRFAAAFNLRDAAILYGQADRLIEVGRYADIAELPGFNELIISRDRALL
jgi:hypothetical protein